MKNIKVKDLMTTNVITVEPIETVTQINNIFKENSFHHVPVVNEIGILTGMVSKTDLDKIQTGATLFRNPKVNEYNESIFATLLVRDIMSKEVVHLHASDSIESAYRIFKENKHHAIPIVERGALVGIITPLDLLVYFFKE